MNWSYIAGLFDGDGSISARETKTRNLSFGDLYVGLYSTNREVIEKIHAFIGIGNFYVRKKGERNEYRIIIHKQKEMLFFLKKIYPHLIVKKEKAKWAIKWLETNLSRPGFGKPTYDPKIKRKLKRYWKKLRDTPLPRVRKLNLHSRS